jgi:hypothetical protein
MAEPSVDLDFLAAVGQCCESLAALSRRIGKPVPHWDTCTGCVVLDPLEVLSHQAAVQELDARVAANTVRPRNCRYNPLYGPGSGGDSGDDSVSLTNGGPGNTFRLTNRCRQSSCGDVYGWPNAGPSTFGYGSSAPTAVVYGGNNGAPPCGLLGQGGFRL